MLLSRCVSNCVCHIGKEVFVVSTWILNFFFNKKGVLVIEDMVCEFWEVEGPNVFCYYVFS